MGNGTKSHRIQGKKKGSISTIFSPEWVLMNHVFELRIMLLVVIGVRSWWKRVEMNGSIVWKGLADGLVETTTERKERGHSPLL